jgi:hypothetical protein
MGGPEIFIDSMRTPIKLRFVEILEDLKKSTRSAPSLDDVFCDFMREMRKKGRFTESRDRALMIFDEEMTLLDIKDY